MIVSLKPFIKENKFFLIGAVIIFIFYIIFQLSLFQTNTEYDHNRDLVVVRELSEKGTFSYFGQAYVINPPLNYIIHAFPVWLFGNFDYVIQKVVEIFLFWIGVCLIYFVADEILKNKQKALYAFIIAALSWSFILASAIRSYAIILVVCGVLLLTYLKYLRTPSKNLAIAVGIAIGLALLTKSSLMFLIGIVIVHFLIMLSIKRSRSEHLLIFIAVALLIYSPYLLYTISNGLPMPWDAYSMSTGQNAGWLKEIGYVHPPIWSNYSVLFSMWPVLAIAAIIATVLFLLKEPDRLRNEILLLVLIFLVVPLLNWFVVASDIHHWFYIFTVLPILATYMVFKVGEHRNLPSTEEKAETTEAQSTDQTQSLNTKQKVTHRVKQQALFVIVLMLVLLTWIIHMPVWGSDLKTYWNNDVFKFMSGLQKNETVLSEWDYTLFDVLSQSYAEHSVEFDPIQLAVFGADYYISRQNLDTNYTVFYKSLSTPNNITIYIYKTNLPKIYDDYNITSRGKLMLVNSLNKPVTKASCEIYSGGWKIPQVSNNAGEIGYIVPNGWDGTPKITCLTIGYKKYDGVISSSKINMGSLSSFQHKYQGMRY